MKKFANGDIFVALDIAHSQEARSMAAITAPYCTGIKIGLEYFTKFGPGDVRALCAEIQKPLFLDLKFHDIPNTVAAAIRSVISLRPALLTLHVSGGLAMLRAAKTASLEAAVKANIPPPLLLGVTLLTSLEQKDLQEIGYQKNAKEQILQMGDLALKAGMDGLVCSGEELNLLRHEFGEQPLLVVPGIRMDGDVSEDQKRIMTPQRAVEEGADILVIGRPITKAADPAHAARTILKSLESLA